MSTKHTQIKEWRVSKMLKTGYYDFEGNLVIYEGSDIAYDVDSASWIPAELLFIMGSYICSLEEGAEKYGY